MAEEAPLLETALALAAVATALVGLVGGSRVAAVATVVFTTSAGLVAPEAIEGASMVEALDIVIFVGAMILVAGAWEGSGLLAAIADRLLAATRRPYLLLGATYLRAVAVTTVFNLDTTAVLFTPLALQIASRSGQPTVPFALASVLGANFVSMLLPSSNLTNLVLSRGNGITATAFIRPAMRSADGLDRQEGWGAAQPPCVLGHPRTRLSRRRVRSVARSLGRTAPARDVGAARDFAARPRSLSEPGGAGLGTLGLHPELLGQLVADAGFGTFELHDFDEPANLYYEVRV